MNKMKAKHIFSHQVPEKSWQVRLENYDENEKDF